MTKPYTVVVTTVPFGAFDSTPLKLIENAGVKLIINPLGKKLRPEEVADVIGDADIVIAGTEKISKKVLSNCPNIKAIFRVGIGLDSVDLLAARSNGIEVCYTPDGPSPAVAELTIGLMIDLLRGVTKADRDIRDGIWQRKGGRRVSQCCIGIIGCGRIGGRVVKHLMRGFPGVQILANDINPNPELDGLVEWVEKDVIYERCDVISLHIPLTPETQNLITASNIRKFKRDSILINTARGGIVNEIDLAEALGSELLMAAGIDVFEDEPYLGPLCELENAILTCHLGSMTIDCRARMEIEATQDAIRYINGIAPANPVPQDEYDMAERMAIEKQKESIGVL